MPEASLPVTLKLVSDRWVGQRTPPHHRKSVEMAVIVRATSKEQAAMELESLAQHLRGAGRDGMLGNVGGRLRLPRYERLRGCRNLHCPLSGLTTKEMLLSQRFLTL